MTTHPDTPRPAATDGDSIAPLFTLTIADVVQRYTDAGLPKNPRTVQRYAAAGKIKAQKIMTATGELYLINADSVGLHLTELRQLEAQARLVASGRDLSRPDGNEGQPPFATTRHDTYPRPAPTSHDMSPLVAHATPTSREQRYDDSSTPKPPTDPDAPRPAATRHDAPVDERYLKQLERENEFLRGQINKKDTQIEALAKLAESTNTNVSQQNTLLQGFQRLFGLGYKPETKDSTQPNL